MCSRSMTTEVSIRPRAWRRVSATRSGGLACETIEIASKPPQVYRGRVSERRCSRLRSNETPSSEGEELPDRHAIAGHDERLALIELAHDLTAAIAQLALRDLAGHGYKCSTACYGNEVVDAPAPDAIR